MITFFLIQIKRFTLDIEKSHLVVEYVSVSLLRI